MKGTSSFTPVFSSRLAPVFARYVDLKRALGRRFDLPARTLQSLDRFLCDQSAKYSGLNAAAFQAWWFGASACIAAGPNRSASFRTPVSFRYIING